MGYMSSRKIAVITFEWRNRHPRRRARAVVNTSAAPRPVTKMSRAALLCCTALALFSVGAAHAQQGNLPTPVQKLPAYPPVACVTPNWRPEPCEGRHDIRQVMEEDRAQPALPLLNSRNTPRAFECIKPAEPGWLGLGGLFQLLDCTWFGWIEPYPVKPFDGKWPASLLAEPVKCLKPDGREEPCESELSCARVSDKLPVEPDGSYLNLRVGPGTEFKVKVKLRAGTDLNLDAVS